MVPEDKFPNFRRQTFTETKQNNARSPYGSQKRKRQEEEGADWKKYCDNLLQYVLEIKLTTRSDQGEQV